MSSIYMYAWEYLVRPDSACEFLEVYGSNGLWVALFRGSPGYIRTELFSDLRHPNRFVTLDYWESAKAWQEFRSMRSSEFEDLDARCEKLTIEEREIGRFRPASDKR